MSPITITAVRRKVNQKRPKWKLARTLPESTKVARKSRLRVSFLPLLFRSMKMRLAFCELESRRKVATVGWQLLFRARDFSCTLLQSKWLGMKGGNAFLKIQLRSIEKRRQELLVLMTSENVEKRRTEKADTRISLVIKVKTWSDKRQMQHSKHLTVLGARTNFLWIINFDGTFSAWTRTKYILRAQTEEKLRELNQTVSLSRSSQSLLWLIKLCVFQFHNSSCVRNFSRNERLPRRIGLQPPTKSESLKTRHIKKKIQLNRKTIKSWVISISLVELIFFHPVFCVNLLELFSFPWNSVSVSSSTTHLLFGCLAWIAEEQLNLRGQKVLRIITGFRGSLARYENTWGIQSYSKLQCTITKSWGKYWNKVRREENNSKACCALFIFFNSRKRERRNLFLYFVSRLSRVFVSFYSPTQIADHKKAKFPSCQSPQQAQ